MFLYVLTIRDRAANVFGQPVYNLSTGAAVRGFKDEINRSHEGNLLYTHPEDFDLYELGIYDDSDGTFKLHEKPVQLCLGRDLVNPPKESPLSR